MRHWPASYLHHLPANLQAMYQPLNARDCLYTVHLTTRALLFLVSYVMHSCHSCCCAQAEALTQMNAFTIDAKAAKDSAAPAVCTTKPFGQCAGMNFTAGAVGYRFSAKAEPRVLPEGQSAFSLVGLGHACLLGQAAPKRLC